MFEYDPEKSAANLAKHGIDFEQAQTIWNDDKRITRPTYPGDDGEVRWIVIGVIANKLWTVVMSERGDTVRIISVRRSRDRERKAYHGQDD